MHLEGSIDYLMSRVVAAVAIAVVAATVALWLAMTVRRPLAILASALVMGVSVNGMHFTGMSAMSVRPEPEAGASVTGASVSSLLIPIGVTVIFGILGLVYALMAAPTEDLAARLEAEDDDLYEPAPEQNGGRVPTSGASWTFRDRAGQ